MKTIASIALQTLRATVRTRLFMAVIVAIVLGSLYLTLNVSGGHNIVQGQSPLEICQATLTYSLGSVLFLIAAATIWTACLSLSRDIESYSIHLVVTKPCTPGQLWFGKWLGVFGLYASIFLVAATAIYGIFMLRIHQEFKGDDMAKLKNELLVGRTAIRPVPRNVEAEALQQYNDLKENNQLPFNVDPVFYREFLAEKIRARNLEIPVGMGTAWQFEGIHVPPDSTLYIRYRVYVGYVDKYQKKAVNLGWEVQHESKANPGTIDEGKRFFQPGMISHTFHEFELQPKYAGDDGKFLLICYNMPKADGSGDKAIIQPADGPFVLARESGFFSNYARSVLLALFLLAFLAALGTTVGAAFGPPVAAFVGVSYLVIGLLLQSIIADAGKNYSEEPVEVGRFDSAVLAFNKGLGKVFVSVNDLNATESLVKGEYVSWRHVGETAGWLLLFRGGLIVGLGILVLHRREYAKEARK